jgi:hypothetical protein
MKEDLNFFGVPEENINAARRRQPTRRNSTHTTVPSRREIATLPPDKLKDVLLAWMELSATEIIPSRAQIALVKDDLLRKNWTESDVKFSARFILEAGGAP